MIGPDGGRGRVPVFSTCRFDGNQSLQELGVEAAHDGRSSLGVWFEARVLDTDDDRARANKAGVAAQARLCLCLFTVNAYLEAAIGARACAGAVSDFNELLPAEPADTHYETRAALCDGIGIVRIIDWKAKLHDIADRDLILPHGEV